MKWNWGTKIALLYTLFVLFIVSMVYLSFNQKFDLVTEDYYAEEIAYQETIDKKAHAEELESHLQAQIEGANLKIIFPNKNEALAGKLKVFRPSDKDKDFNLKIETENSVFNIPLEKFVKGKYLLKVDWEVSDNKYYQELTVIIP